MIPESFINELKYRCDAEQIIGAYVQLKKTGRYLKGLCPFHSEKTPSFVVYPENQSFYCFGCGAGGSVINFIMKIENLDYVEAVRLLAQRVGMQMPEEAGDDEGYKRRTRILELNREAARQFHRLLMSDPGRDARAYLVGRGLTGATVTRFGLGYAPDSWDALTGHLLSMGFTREELLESDLARKGRSGGVYDTFRWRVMFPIIDLRGNVIGFGGRNLNPELQGQKYLNSGDTPVYKKSRNLFALNFAKNSKRRGLILCEGYMDAIAMHQAGFDNAVAGLGTALTGEQARLIAQYADEVTLAYDGDEPGQKATRRSSQILDETGIRIRVLTVTGAKDPDEFIKTYGAERFELLLDGSSGASEYEIARLKKQNDLETAEGKVAFLKDFVDLLARMPSPIERDVYLSKICRELGVEKTAVQAQLDATLRRRRSAEKKSEARSLRPYTAQQAAGERDEMLLKYPKFVRAEERILAYLVHSPERGRELSEKLKPEDFISDTNRELYAVLMRRISDGGGVDMLSLSGELSPKAATRLAGICNTAQEAGATDEETWENIKTLLSFGQRKSDDEIKELDDDDLKRYIQSRSAEKKQGVD